MEDIIKGVFVDPNSSLIEEMIINDNVKSFKKLLGVKYINLVSRKINGVNYCIVSKDEINDNDLPSIISPVNKYDCIYGKVFICKIDEEGSFKSLSDKEIFKLILFGKTFISNDMMFKAIWNYPSNVGSQ